jgi:hypothetical protein
LHPALALSSGVVMPERKVEAPDPAQGDVAAVVPVEPPRVASPDDGCEPGIEIPT